MVSSERKAAVITGASRGIGKACAELFAEKGYNLGLICLNNVDKLKVYSAELLYKYSAKSICLSADVSDYDMISRAIEQCYNEFGRIDVLVNNAGISHFGLLSELSFEEWNRIMAVNLNSVFYSCKKTIPIMRQIGGGSIVNIASIWGESGASCEVAYSASKGGVIAFTKALGKELALSNISVNAVSPGVVETDMNSRLTTDEIRDIVLEIPIDRMGKVFEIARIIFDVANAPKFLTGQVIRVDGGML